MPQGLSTWAAVAEQTEGLGIGAYQLREIVRGERRMTAWHLAVLSEKFGAAAPLIREWSTG